MLTTVHAARGLAIRINSMWPSCRLPIVGTKTLFGSRCSLSRSAAAEWMMSMGRRLERVLGPRERTGFDFLHVKLDRALDRPGELHIVLHEPRLLPGKDVEHVVEHEHLPMAVTARADAYCRPPNFGSDQFRERGGNH